MDKLIKKIKDEGYVIDNKIVKVDHFINHMLDSKLVNEIGLEFSKVFKNITKILTIEASGIAYAVATAFHMNHVPIVFARKTESLITSDDLLKSDVYSFTKQKTSTIIVDSAYINKDDNILIIDDFLAKGNAALGLIDIVNQKNATIAGVGIVIEKGFEPGRKRIEELGINVHSLALIKKLENNKIVF